MSRPIDIDATLDASGGSNDSTEQTAQILTDAGALQVEVGGSTTDVTIHLDARLGDDLAWVTDYITAEANQSNGYRNIRQIDLGDINQVRVRCVNNDANNTATVKAVVRTD